MARTAPSNLPRSAQAPHLFHSAAYSRVGLEFRSTLTPKDRVALSHLLTWIGRGYFCQQTALLLRFGRSCSPNAESLQNAYIR
jgi:hypothetical protein